MPRLRRYARGNGDDEPNQQGKPHRNGGRNGFETEFVHGNTPFSRHPQRIPVGKKKWIGETIRLPRRFGKRKTEYSILKEEAV